eukprot:GEMP01004792.1.p1 GENE.GEMP01004792.1~~GEMP01004792.1.p1  ORF type:complete len:730 (+),score=214.49 GEMP01004792.1:142-2331(+)
MAKKLLPRSPKEATAWIRRRTWHDAMRLVAKLPSSLLDAHTLTAVLGCKNAPPGQSDAVLDLMRRASIRPTEVTYGAAISSADSVPEAMRIFNLASKDPCVPRSGPLLALLKVCKNKKAWQQAVALLDAYPSELQDSHWNLALTACAHASLWERALQVFSRVPAPTQQTYNCVIAAYARAREWERAVELCEELESSKRANVVTFNTTIFACERAAQWEAAVRIGEKMGGMRDIHTYGSLISACEKGKQWEMALHWLQRTHAANMSSVVCYNAAMAACVSEWPHAILLLRRCQSLTLRPDTISYNSCIAALQKGRKWVMALELLAEMDTHRIPKDTITYNTAISTLAKGRKWQMALQMFHHVDPTDVTIGAQCDAFASAMQWEKALALVEHPFANTVAFSAALTACARAKQWEKALQLLATMRARNVAPDSISYNATIRACETSNNPTAAREIAAHISTAVGEQKDATASLDAVGMSSMARMQFVDEAVDAARQWATGNNPNFVKDPHHAVHLLHTLGPHAPAEFVHKVRDWVFDRTVTALRKGDVDALRRFGVPNLGPLTREALDALQFGYFDPQYARAAVAAAGAVTRVDDVRARDVVVHIRSSSIDYVFRYGGMSEEVIGKTVEKGVAGEDEHGDSKDFIVSVDSTQRSGIHEWETRLPSVYVHHDRSLHAERQALLWLLRRGAADEVVELYVTHRPCVSCMSAMVAYGNVAGEGRLKVAFDELDDD